MFPEFAIFSMPASSAIQLSFQPCHPGCCRKSANLSQFRYNPLYLASTHWAVSRMPTGSRGPGTPDCSVSELDLPFLPLLLLLFHTPSTLERPCSRPFHVRRTSYPQICLFFQVHSQPLCTTQSSVQLFCSSPMSFPPFH